LVTAAHVLERGFPVRIGQRQLEGIDIIRRGRTRGSRTDALGDWVLFRAAPFEGRGWAAATDAHAPHGGQHAVLRGFVRSKDASGQLTPLLVEIPVRFRNRPWWMSGEELDSFRFVDPLDGAARLDLSGMSGGPVLVEDGSGREWLVGI